MTTESLLWLIPLPPLLAFFLIVLFTNRNKALSHSVAVGAALLSWLGSMFIFFQAIGVEDLSEHPIGSSINWLATGDTFLKIGMVIDPLGAVTLFFVAWTVLCIFIYSVGYHNFGQPKGDHDQKGLPPHGATETDVHGHKHGVLSIENSKWGPAFGMAASRCMVKRVTMDRLAEWGTTGMPTRSAIWHTRRARVMPPM